MKSKISHLEGLRGLMAFIIFICHLRNFMWYQELDSLYQFLNSFYIGKFFKYLLQFILLGDYAVWVFWILSAYVIMIKLFYQKDEYLATKIWIQSISKRYFRLLIPSLFSILFAYFLLNNSLLFNKILGSQTEHFKTKKWLENIYNIEPNFLLAMKDAFIDTFFNFSFKTTYNGVLWSIENEFLGSIFIFILYIILRKNKYRFIFYLIFAIAIILIKKYWLLSLLIGYILCDIDFSKDSNFIKIQLKKIEASFIKHQLLFYILIPLFLIFQQVIFKKIDIRFNSQDLLTSILIFYAVLKFNVLKQFFSKRIFLYLGKISFALYLIHLPILCSLSSFLLLQNSTGIGKTVISVFTIIITLLISHIFTVLIDHKSVLFSNKIGTLIANYFYNTKET